MARDRYSYCTPTTSVQCRQHLLLKWAQLVRVAGLDQIGPVGVADQGAADGDQVEFVVAHPLDKVVQAGDGGTGGISPDLAKEIFSAQADGANTDGWYAGKLAGPASQIQIRPFKF